MRPSGEKATDWHPLYFRELRGERVAVSQSLMNPSAPAVAIVAPSGENATDVTHLVMALERAEHAAGGDIPERHGARGRFALIAGRGGECPAIGRELDAGDRQLERRE